MAGRRRQEQDPVTTVVYFLVGVAIYGGIIKKWAYVILGSLAAFVVLFIPILKNFLEEQRLNQAGMPEIDKMTGREFERWLTNFFRAKGYRVELTPGQGDWGADLILVGPQGRTAVQAKRWNGNVGRQRHPGGRSRQGPLRLRSCVSSHQLPVHRSCSQTGQVQPSGVVG